MNDETVAISLMPAACPTGNSSNLCNSSLVCAQEAIAQDFDTARFGWCQK